MIDALSSQNKELKEKVLDLEEKLNKEKEKTTTQEIELQLKRGNSLLAWHRKSYLICVEFSVIFIYFQAAFSSLLAVEIKIT